jgi:hypothetical protein
VRAILEEYEYENWRWRMAARRMMDRENVLNFGTIQKLFNKFFRIGHRYFNDLLDGWIRHPDARARLFGVTRTAYQAMTAQQKHQARTSALEQFDDRFAELFQRRHDCIHNCDRPRRRPQPRTSSGHVLKVIQDVEFLVNRCEEHINAEFKQFLVGTGCGPATIAGVGY